MVTSRSLAPLLVQEMLIVCPQLRQEPKTLIAAVTSVLVNAQPALLSNVHVLEQASLTGIC